MTRTTRTITFSLPPEMADKVEELMRQESRTRSELLREALRQYIEDREWKQVLRYGERKSRELGIRPGDVEGLVAEHREEMRGRGD